MITQPTAPRKRILSGVQPSGKLHLGNYFGAVRQHVALTTENADCFYFIADYHALTTVHDPVALRQHVLDVALDYFALGPDPEKAVFFRQSDVPQVCELAWILSTLAPMGLLERAVSYKEKIDRGLESSVGLFTYPVLMAADILICRSNLVPVGRDQVQHLEICRDLAVKFNLRYGEVFPLPEYRLTKESKVPGTDGQKMSKSYGNTIPLFEDEKKLQKAVNKIVTNLKAPGEPKGTDESPLFEIYKAFATPADTAAFTQALADGLAWGEAGAGTASNTASIFSRSLLLSCSGSGFSRKSCLRASSRRSG